LRRVAGVTLPSASNFSSEVGTPTGTIRATGRPRSVTVRVRPARTAARCLLRLSRSSRIPTSMTLPRVISIDDRTLAIFAQPLPLDTAVVPSFIAAPGECHVMRYPPG